MSALNSVLDWMGRRIANRVTAKPDARDLPHHTDIALMQRVLRPGDVVLIDGRDKVSAAIRYLTQSSWSHAALFVGDALGKTTEDGEPLSLIEVNLGDGCIAVPLSKYECSPTRICRPVNLTDEDRQRVISFMCDKIGLTYDTRNVFDLMRYLLPNPPIPRRWRRRMLAIGSGSPTRAICSTLIAQAFQSIRYPILPRVEKLKRGEHGANGYTSADVHHIRHHSLFTPRDFDVSPYFDVVKPTVAEGFNYKGVRWAEAPAAAKPSNNQAPPDAGEDSTPDAGQGTTTLKSA